MLNTTYHFAQVGNKVAHQHMLSTEFAANLFRSTQIEEKLKRDQVSNKAHANQTHFEVGATIEELGGAMPEDLPTQKKSTSQLACAEEVGGC